MRQIIRVAAVGAALAVAACSKPAPEETESDTVVPVMTAAARLGDITATVRASGLVTAAPGAEQIVVAPEAARILEIPKAEGTPVRRGDVLVRFEIPSTAAEAAKQQAEISRAEARLANAQAAQTRARDLFDRGVAARKELEDATREIADARADLTSARAAAAAAETVAGRSVVRATFDGIVSKRSHNPGDLAEPSASDAVLRVVDPRRLEVTAQIPLPDAARVRVGAAAHIAGRDPAGGTPPLSVVSRPAAVQEGAPTVPVRLAFAKPPGTPVGTPVQVEIDAESHRNVVTVPSAAIVHEGDETAVFIAAGDKAQRRQVTVGLTNEERTEITSGVKAGEMVLVSNQSGLPDGAKISSAKAGEDQDSARAGAQKAEP